MPPELRRRLKTPLFTLIALLAMLGVNVLLGSFFIAGRVWIVEVFIAVAMVATVMFFAMEIWKEPPIVRLFSGIGFFWVAILFALTMMDYANR